MSYQKGASADSPKTRTLLASVLLRNIVDRKGGDIDDITERLINGCEMAQASDCQLLMDNTISQLCRSLKNHPICTASSPDVLSSPYFWTPLGFFVGLLFVSIDFLIFYFLCVKKKKT